MNTHSISGVQGSASLTKTNWLRIGLQAAIGSMLAVLALQVIILALAPELAAFKPLDNFVRSALFTFIPAIGATAMFAWLVRKYDKPVTKFLWISAVVLLLSFIPDYFLPLSNRTLAASTAAASLHLVAGVVTVGLILAGYRRSIRNLGPH